jgi:hypothetical protein
MRECTLSVALFAWPVRSTGHSSPRCRSSTPRPTTISVTVSNLPVTMVRTPSAAPLFWITWFIISHRAFCWSYNAVTLALITHVAINEQPPVPTGDSVARRQFSPDLAGGGAGGLTSFWAIQSLPPCYTISLGQIRESRRVDPHSRGGRCRIGIPRRTE